MTRWTNPLIEQRADPHLSRGDGRYWFTASVPSYDAIEIRAADSIAGLATAPTKVIWRAHESGPMSFLPPLDISTLSATSTLQ